MKHKTNITLKQLAEILNVSISTISKALNDSSEISNATKKRIKEAAEIYSYQPNKMAVNLKSGRTNTIGVIIPSIRNNFFTEVLYGIEKTLEDTSYKILVSITNESFKKEESSLESYSNGMVDGIIIAVAEETQTLENYKHIELVLQIGVPIVMFDRIIPSPNLDTIVGDDLEAVYNSVRFLIGKGKKNIAMVSTIHKLNVGVQRHKGFEKGIIETYGKTQKDFMVETSEELLEKSVTRLLKQPVDAVIAMDEESSLAVLKALKKNNNKLQNKIAVIGYANERISENVSPSLTTINQHGFEMGERAALQLLDRLKTNTSGSKAISIPSSLVYRETTSV